VNHVRAFFEAGSAYQEQRQEIEDETLPVIDIVQEWNRTIITASRLLTGGESYTLQKVNWETMGFEDNKIMGQKLNLGAATQKTEEGNLLVGGQTITRERLGQLSKDPIVPTRFYLTLAAAKRGELAGLSPQELAEGLRNEEPLTKLRRTSFLKLNDVTENPTNNEPEIIITPEDLE